MIFAGAYARSQLVMLTAAVMTAFPATTTTFTSTAVMAALTSAAVMAALTSAAVMAAFAATAVMAAFAP